MEQFGFPPYFEAPECRQNQPLFPCGSNGMELNVARHPQHQLTPMLELPVAFTSGLSVTYSAWS